MATAPSSIQVLSRNNYEEQYIVPLPTPLPLAELSPSSIRIRTSILSLTANTTMYGRIGHILGIWDIHPLPRSIPAEYSDPKKFGRIATWGYASVLASNVSGIEAGARVFGFLPVGTLPLDMQVRVNPEVPGQFFEVSEQRASVMSLYNEYWFYPPVASQTVEQKQSEGFDALFRIFFTTSYLINRFVFLCSPAEFVHPGTVDDGWTIEKGSVDNKTVILVFADSGKTALVLAYLLKNARPAGMKPRIVVGIGAAASRAFAEKTGLYDKVLTYDSDVGDLDLQLGLTSDSKVILCEFGSRGGAADRWEDKLRQSHEGNVVQLIVGGEVVPDDPKTATEKFLARTKKAATVFNASRVGDQVKQVVGEKSYFQDLDKEWRLFKERGLVNGLRMDWGEGMEDVGKGWERLCKGEVRSSQGLVFSLD